MDKDYEVKSSGEKQEFSSGAHRDTPIGKGRYDLISMFALKEIARVYEEGARLYGDRNWEKGFPLSRLLDSALRHVCQCIEGKNDENHAAQGAWNLMAFIHTRELIKRGILPKELNDLPNYMLKNVEREEANLTEEDKSVDLTNRYKGKSVFTLNHKIVEIKKDTSGKLAVYMSFKEQKELLGPNFFYNENDLKTRILD